MAVKLTEEMWEAAKKAAAPNEHWRSGYWEAMKAVAPLIEAQIEARVRAECAAICRAEAPTDAMIEAGQGWIAGK